MHPFLPDNIPNIPVIPNIPEVSVSNILANSGGETWQDAECYRKPFDKDLFNVLIVKKQLTRDQNHSSFNHQL